jgi:hypothetical protein
VYETQAPLLRPNYVTSDSPAELDPAALFFTGKAVRLYGGTVLLSEGTNIQLQAETQPVDSENLTEAPEEETSDAAGETLIMISAAPAAEIRLLKMINNVPPDHTGNISFYGEGVYRIRQRYEEFDPDTLRVRLKPAEIFIDGNDRPCCSCEEYLEAYEQVRILYEKQTALIEAYNSLFGRLTQARDDLAEKIARGDRSVRVVYKTWSPSVTGNGTPSAVCKFEVTYTNLRQEPFRFPETLITLVSDTGTARIADVRVTAVPSGVSFAVKEYTSLTITITGTEVPASVRCTIHLEATLISSVPLQPGASELNPFTEFHGFHLEAVLGET